MTCSLECLTETEGLGRASQYLGGYSEVSWPARVRVLYFTTPSAHCVTRHDLMLIGQSAQIRPPIGQQRVTLTYNAVIFCSRETVSSFIRLRQLVTLHCLGLRRLS